MGCALRQHWTLLLFLVPGVTGGFGCKARPGGPDARSQVLASASPSGMALDVNDVSILFPKSGPGQFYPDIRGRAIWPAAAFDDLMAFCQSEDGVPVTDPELDPAKIGRIRCGQFILDKPFLDDMARVKARRAPTSQDSARVRAAIEVNEAISSNTVRCEDLEDGRKLCIDTGARVSFLAQRQAIANLDNWRVVGMRVDLCAGANNDANEQCEIEFRLTAQPFGDAASHMFDASAHLLYRLGFLDVKTGKISGAPPGVAFTLQEIIRDLQLIKAAGAPTDGMPLGVHPGLKRELKESGSAVGNEVARVINKYTRGGAGMTFAATMQLAGEGDTGVWVFYHGPVDNGRWLPGVITGSETTWSIRTASVKGPRGRMFPPTEVHSDRPSINPMFNYNRGEPLPPDVQDLPSFFDNPGRYGDVELKVGSHVAASVRNADCVGCHSSTIRSFGLGIRTFDPTPGAKRALMPSLHQPPVGTTAYLDPEVIPRNGYSMRNFGYFVSPPIGNPRGQGVEIPAVMSRVVVESAELVNLINTRYIGKANPGLTCAPGGSENEDPEAALAASQGDDVFSESNQRKIRRTQNVHAMIFDCLLFESHKPGGTFKACADLCQKPGRI